MKHNARYKKYIKDYCECCQTEKDSTHNKKQLYLYIDRKYKFFKEYQTICAKCFRSCIWKYNKEVISNCYKCKKTHKEVKIYKLPFEAGCENCIVKSFITELDDVMYKIIKDKNGNNILDWTGGRRGNSINKTEYDIEVM